jgi:hypothetical protein
MSAPVTFVAFTGTETGACTCAEVLDFVVVNFLDAGAVNFALFVDEGATVIPAGAREVDEDFIDDADVEDGAEDEGGGCDSSAEEKV